MRGVLRVVLVHVSLAAVAVAAVVVWGTGSDPAHVDRRVTVADAVPRRPVNPELVALVRPPGTVVMDTTKEKHGAWLSAVLPAQETEYLDGAGVVYVKALVSRDGEFSQGVWQLAVRDGADPVAALHVADDLYAAGGWAAADGAAGVLVRTHEPTAELPLAAYRAHYVRGRYLIRIEAYGPEPERVRREFHVLAERQLALWPPG